MNQREIRLNLEILRLHSFFHKLHQFCRYISKDKVFVLACIVVTIISGSNIINKIVFNIEPVQYSLFSYDKIQHLLMSIIFVRIIYGFFRYNRDITEDIHEETTSTGNLKKKLILKASILTLILYGLIWEPFEIFMFLIQNSSNEQLYQELFDVPLDWLYDIAGILTSYIVGYD